MNSQKQKKEKIFSPRQISRRSLARIMTGASLILRDAIGFFLHRAPFSAQLPLLRRRHACNYVHGPHAVLECRNNDLAGKKTQLVVLGDAASAASAAPGLDLMKFFLNGSKRRLPFLKGGEGTAREFQAPPYLTPSPSPSRQQPLLFWPLRRCIRGTRIPAAALSF